MGTQMSAVEQWLTPDEVAERLKLHRGTVYRLVSSGVLPAHRIDRAIRIDAAELDWWLRARPEERRTRQGVSDE